jgi:predicted membrane chloride channel (bestrophin family)
MANKTGHDGKRRNDLPLAAISNCIQTHNDEVQDFRQGNQRKKVISARALMQI